MNSSVVWPKFWQRRNILTSSVNFTLSVSVFCLGHHHLKHKTTRYVKNLGANLSPWLRLYPWHLISPTVFLSVWGTFFWIFQWVCQRESWQTGICCLLGISTSSLGDHVFVLHSPAEEKEKGDVIVQSTFVIETITKLAKIAQKSKDVKVVENNRCLFCVMTKSVVCLPGP